jgi:hypothetical protein
MQSDWMEIFLRSFTRTVDSQTAPLAPDLINSTLGETCYKFDITG